MNRSTSRPLDSSSVAEGERARVKQLARAGLFGEAPPLVAGRYRLLEFLGRGGLGEVYRAQDVRLGRGVAVKFLIPTQEGALGEQQLLHEALTLARLSHPCIVPVFDVGTVGDEMFVVMELVPGVPLDRLLARGPLPWREAARLFTAIAEALAAAHETGVIHGDVKPANVIVKPDGRPCLLDFGLARVDGMPTSRVGGAGSSTRPSGTRGFLAPERFDGTCDARTDQFAFFAALYLALSGRLPTAEQGRPTAAELRVDFGRIDVPRALAALVRRGLAIDPAARWSDMSEASEALARIDRAQRRRPWMIAGAAGGFAALGLAWAVHDEPCARVGDETKWSLRQAPARAPASAAAAAETRRTAFTADAQELARSSCEALQARSISGALFDLRVACLERTRDAADHAMAAAEAAGFDRWASWAAALHEVSDTGACRDDEALLDGRPPDDADPELESTIQRGLDRAYVSLLLGDPHGYLEQLQSIEGNHADWARAPFATAWLATHLGSALNQLGRHEEAIDVLRPALLAARRRGRWRTAEGMLLVHLAEARAAQPAGAAEAVFLAEQAVATLAADRVPGRIAAGERALAVATLAAGRPEDAVAALDRAESSDRIPTPSSVAEAAAVQHRGGIAVLRGLSLERLGRTAEAEAIYRAGLAAADDPAAQLAKIDLATNLGALLLADGRAVEAAAPIREALAIATQLGLRGEQATALGSLAYVELQTIGVDAALRRYDEALGAADNPRQTTQLHFNRGVTLQGAGRMAEAWADYDAVLAAATIDLVSPPLRFAARSGRGQTAAALGRTAEAQADLAAALLDEPAQASVFDRAEVRLALAELLPAPLLPRARDLVDQAVALAEPAGFLSLVERAAVWRTAHP